jgi:hypothetical protein
MAQKIMAIAAESPQGLVYGSLTNGYIIGKSKTKGFDIGTTASALLVAMPRAVHG